jgi:hypothetical protein
MFIAFCFPKHHHVPQNRATGEPDRQLQHFRQPARSSVAVAASRETWKNNGGFYGDQWQKLEINGI